MDEGMKRQGYTYSDCQNDLAEREDDLIKQIQRYELTGMNVDYTTAGEVDGTHKEDADKINKNRKKSLLQVQTLRYNLIVAQFDRFNLSRVTPGKASHYLSCGTNLRNARSEQEWAMMASLNGEIRSPLLEASKESKEQLTRAKVQALAREGKEKNVDVSDTVSPRRSFRGRGSGDE